MCINILHAHNSTMKCLVFIAFLAAVELSISAPDPKMLEIFTACQKENKVTDQEFQTYLKTPMDHAVATNGIKCQMKCLMEKLGMFKGAEPIEAGFMDTFGKLTNPKVKPEDVKKQFPTCKSEKGANDCETVYKIMYCFRKAGLALH